MKKIILLVLVVLLLASGVQAENIEIDKNNDLNEEWKEDVFLGKATNLMLEEKINEGVIVYDENCVPVGDNLTNCDAGIEIDNVGILNMNYTHNMNKKPCLSPNQKVLVVKGKEDSLLVAR